VSSDKTGLIYNNKHTSTRPD